MKEREPKLIDSRPGLKDIYNTLGLLEGYTDFKKDVSEKIGPWENSSELFENVQKVVLDHVRDKIVSFKEKTSATQGTSKEDITDAIVNNWFETVPEMRGQRREVLLAVAAHVIRHIETKVYQSILANTQEEELKKLGLIPDLREVAIKILDAGTEVDLLFIRFLAFASLSSKPPEEATSSHFYVPSDNNPHTINKLFPKETQYLARKFKEISEMNIDWKNIPGGEIFQKYLIAISESYVETDIDKIDEKYQEVTELYGQSVRSEFPILLVSTEHGAGYTKEPYSDPELRIGLRSAECVAVEESLSKSQEVMVESFIKKGYPDLAKNLKNKKTRVINSIGDYGSPIYSKAPAQTGSGGDILMFLAEEGKIYDDSIKTRKYEINGLDKKEGKNLSFFTTLFHEYGHIHLANDPAIKRFGPKANTTIDETKAEQVYRWFLPELSEKGVIGATKEKLAAAALDSSLFELGDKDPRKDACYYYSAAYTLNRLFAEGVVEFNFETGGVSIKDIDAFYKIQEEQSKEVLSLYTDELMNEKKANKWIKQNCMPNEIVKKISKFIKGGLIANELPQSFKEKSSKVFSWETAWIKKPDANNPDDVEAIKHIDAEPGVQEFMVGPPLTEEDFEEKGFYSICGEKDEKGMEGFVWVYGAGKKLINRLIEQKLIDSKDAKILEISFARYIDPNASPESQKRGLVSSAVRQICFSMIENQKNIIITAFTNPENPLSENVLKGAGFVTKGKVFYNKKSKKQDNFWVLDKKELEKILRRKKQSKFDLSGP